MKTVLFSDLDDSLFSSERAHAARGSKGPFVHATVPGAGKPGLMDATQQAFWSIVHPACEVVPVTARSKTALERVTLPGHRPNLGAIVSNGALVLDAEGRVDTTWFAHTRAIADQALEALDAVARLAQAESDLRTLPQIEDGTVLAVTVKCAEHTGARAEERLRTWWNGVVPLCKGVLWMHANGNGLSAIPVGISKAHAVAWMIERLRAQGPILTLGMGDSLGDAGFMARCDIAIAPTHSQLFQTLPQESVHA
jgi:hydroxymethylpyrimidine pyrophosphatase-like HAD family hydrolase